MAQTTTVICDACGSDLTYTSNCEDYYLTLGNSSKRKWYEKDGLDGGFVTAMGINPKIPRTHHFCDLQCLDYWRDRERLKRDAWREWNQNWEREHGTKTQFGTITPCASEEVLKPVREAIEATALEAFPMLRPH